MHPKKTTLQMRICRTVAAAAAVWLFVMLSVCDARAHNVTVFAWVDGDTVYVESKFSGGRRSKNAPIEVYDGSGNLLLKGQTDDQGKFFFQVPQKTEMKIVLQAGMGHRAEWVVTAEDLEGFDPTATVPESQGPTDSAPAQPPERVAPTNASSAAGGPTAAEIEEAVEKVVDRKLKPVIQLLAESRQTGPDLRDILGGIGYIIGLVGLAAYLRQRRSSRSPESPAAGNQPPATDDSLPSAQR